MPSGPPTAHQLVQTMVRKWVLDRLGPRAAEFDREGRVAPEMLAELGRLGCFGVFVPENMGGAGLNHLAFALVIDELSRGLGSLGTMLTVHHLYCSVLLGHGTPEQQRRYLAPFARGDRLGAFALTEPGCGSDAAALRTRALRDGSDWVLSGTKNWVTNGPSADALVVFATRDPRLGKRGLSAFLVPRDTPGLGFSSPEDTLGVRAAPSCTVTMDDCRLSGDALLGEEGRGFEIAMASLAGARIGMAAQAAGIAQSAFDVAAAHARDRFIFGRQLVAFQATQMKLADVAMRIRAARLLTREAACAMDTGEPSRELVATAKVMASETATFAAHTAMQVLGASGYSRDCPAERFYRDARVTEIYAGTSEIMRLVVAREALGCEVFETAADRSAPRLKPGTRSAPRPLGTGTMAAQPAEMPEADEARPGEPLPWPGVVPVADHETVVIGRKR
jgi:butyryl-CoA dehydrogenase